MSLDAMLDIETLGTEADAVVASMAVALFDDDGSYASFFCRFNIQQQLDKGRTVTGDTLRFWLNNERTSTEARGISFGVTEGRDIEAAFSEFNYWWKTFTDDGTKVWAKGPSFDGAIMGNLANQFGVTLPWSFWDYRCVRTILDLCGGIDTESLSKLLPNPDLLPHSPLDDCEWQIAEVQAAKSMLTRRV